MLFVSKCRELRLIRRPTDIVIDEKRRSHVIRGEVIEFRNNRYETEDPDLIEWMLSHYTYGNEFTSDRNDQALLKAKADAEAKEVKIVVGADSTVNNRLLDMTAEVPRGIPEVVTTTGISKEEVVKIVGEQLGSFKDEILAALRSGQPAPKPRKSFRCPVPNCRKEFDNGFDVGKHKKEFHADLYAEPSINTGV